MADDHLKKKLPELPLLAGEAAQDDLTYIWDSSAGVLKRMLVSQLPDKGDEGEAVTLLGSPFKLRFADSQVGIITDDNGTHTRITDPRLAKKTDYPVSSTQVNNAFFRDEELVYDSAIGRVTILDFELQMGEVIALFPAGTNTDGDEDNSLTAILDRITKLEAIAAPFMLTESGGNGGLVLWNKPANQIPAGWAEDTEWRGRMPVGFDQNDEDFDGIGDTGGSKTHTITLEEMPPHTHNQDSGVYNDARRSGSNSQQVYQVGGLKPTSSTGGYNDGGVQRAKPMNIMNPFRIVMFIKYVGI